MASIIKRGKTWQYTVSRYIDGEYKPIRKGGFQTKREASTAAAIIEGDIAKGDSPITQKILFSEYFRQWVDDYKSSKTKETYIRYKTTANTIDKDFEGIYIQDITKRQYQRFMDEYGKTRERATLVKINMHIRGCVKDAIDDGVLRVDFTRGVQLHPQIKSVSKSDKQKMQTYAEGCGYKSDCIQAFNTMFRLAFKVESVKELSHCVETSKLRSFSDDLYALLDKYREEAK